MDNYDINALTEMQKKRKKSKIISWIMIGIVIAIGITIAAVAAYGLIIFRNKIIEYKKIKEEKNEKSNM